jgi:hypothetical protein
MRSDETERRRLAAISRVLRDGGQVRWSEDAQLFGCDRWHAVHADGATTREAMAAHLDGLAQGVGNQVIDGDGCDQALMSKRGDQEANGLGVAVG